MDAAGKPVTLEMGPIRPPSEAFSLLVRVSRNCPWNRCLFCPVYKGARFELRPVAEVKRDIDAAAAIVERVEELARQGCDGDVARAAAGVYRAGYDQGVGNVALWLCSGAENAFLQDANSLIVRTPDLAEIVRYLRARLPSIRRVTSYGRSKTAARKSLQGLVELREAGLSRLHVGLESGSDAVLAFMDKGVTAADHVAGGRLVMEAGIELSEYAMPGLGGRRWRREHAEKTACILNQVSADFIRLRSLMVREDMPLFARVVKGEFELCSEDEVVEEIGWLIQGLSCDSELKSDHMMNLLPEVEGRLPQDRGRLLAMVGAYLDLPGPERLNFQVGRRTGHYWELRDMADPVKRETVDRIVARLASRGADGVSQALAELRAQRM